MGFRSGSYAKVWEINTHEKSASVKLSICKKKKDGEGYDKEFESYVLFLGHAFNKIGTIKAEDKIKLADIDVKCIYNKENGKTYTSFLVYDFEKDTGERPQKASAPAEEKPATAKKTKEDDELPF